MRCSPGHDDVDDEEEVSPLAQGAELPLPEGSVSAFPLASMYGSFVPPGSVSMDKE